MKRFSLIAASFIFTAIFTASAFGQAPAASNVRIVVINTAAFDTKEGITKYTSAMNTLEKEFAPAQTELQALATSYQTKVTAFQNEQKNAANSTVPINASSLQAKGEEIKNLELQIKRKQEDGKAKFESRQTAAMGPVLRDIGKAMDEFAKQKGYDLILDATKLEGAGLILAVVPVKVDVTKEFITFYNARPPGTATATNPK